MSVKIDQKKGQRHKYWQRKHSFRRNKNQNSRILQTTLDYNDNLDKMDTFLESYLTKTDL